jgi:uncharacterized protein YbcI
MTGAQGTRAAALSNAIVALMAECTGRGAPKSRCRIDENLIVCVHDNPTKGELSLVKNGKDEAALAIRRNCQHSTGAELIAFVERLSARKVAALMSVNTSTRTLRSNRLCSSSETCRRTINKANPDARPMHSADPPLGELIGESQRGLVMCRDHDASPVARGEAPVAAGAVEPTERTPSSAGGHRRVRGACPSEPGLPLPPRLVRFAQRTSAPISAAVTVALRSWSGNSGPTAAMRGRLSGRRRSGLAGVSA